ncbi:MAG: Phosphoribulokinase / Uridine kinase family [Thermomicrobiales bacterium]|nr:Phosphoribulokinase / Uridine kinase family [Thermomicrobiales bacterium]
MGSAMDGTNGRLILSICGPSGAGKSQLANALVGCLGPDLCARVPTDYYAVPAIEPLSAYFTQPLRYDWTLLARVLALPEGTAVSTPDFDFERFQRLHETGGRPFTIRPVMVLDAMEPYPHSDARILLVGPDHVRRERIAARDQIWNTHVRDRWHHLEVTWAHARTLMPACDLELDGTEPIVENAERLANWLRDRYSTLICRRAGD